MFRDRRNGTEVIGSQTWHNLRFAEGEVAEWLMAADCKSALLRVRWFESSPLHQRNDVDLYTYEVSDRAQWRPR